MIEAIVLCGGSGTRLKRISGDLPKPMVAIGGRPFLELLLRQLHRHGFGHVILASGYREEVIRSFFGDRALDLDLTYSSEATPLGTGGALRNAIAEVNSETVLVMNGDSYTDANLTRFTATYLEGQADVSMVVVPTDGRSDCGSVAIDNNGKVLRFEEKQVSSGTKYINAGLYLVPRDFLNEVPPGRQVSLENEILTRWLKMGRDVRAFVYPGPCIDIGTPERYRSAQELLANVEAKE